jgi:hypothetical protein
MTRSSKERSTMNSETNDSGKPSGDVSPEPLTLPKQPAAPRRRLAATTTFALISIVALGGSGVIRGLGIGGDEQAEGCGAPQAKGEMEAVGSNAQAASTGGMVFATHDTYLQHDNKTFPSAPDIQVKNVGNSYTTRKGLIRFDVPNVVAGSASLSLDVSWVANSAGPATATMFIWGIKDDAAPSCQEFFSYGMLGTNPNYNNVPFFADNSSGVDVSSACLHDADPSQAYVQPLGTLTISASDMGKTVTLSNAALTSFMSQNTNGIVSIAITRAENSSTLESYFASREHTSLKGPRLSWTPTVQTAAVAAADTYVQRNNSGPYGSSADIQIMNAGPGSASNRNGLVRFSVPNGKIASANLSMDVSWLKNNSGGSTTSTFKVWGIKDGSGSACGENFDAATARYGDLPFLDSSADGINTSSACIHDGDPTVAGAQPLGSFTVTQADQSHTVSFGSRSLAEFMRQNTNGVVTLAFTRVEANSQLATYFASSEHGSLKGPRLTWTESETYTAISDTYVMGDNSGGHSGEGGIVVTDFDGANYDRKGLISFSVPSGNFADASLALKLATYAGNGQDSATFNLFGITDGSAASCQEFFDDSVVYSSVPFLDSTADGVKNGHACLSSLGPLATVTAGAADVGKAVTFTSPALAQFLNANTNSNVTFVLTTSTVGPYAAFASQENSANQPPTLTVTPGDLLTFDDGNLVPQAGGSFKYNGTLHVPVGGGQMIGFPSADVTMTLNARGRISTISGTVGFPQVPSAGLWSDLGGIQGETPYLQFGYDYASAFPNFDLPIDPKSKFFYAAASSEVSMSWGPMSMSAPGAAELLLAVDPTTPAIWAHMAQDGTFMPVATSSDFGFSNDHNIPFSPASKWGVESQMTPFSGDYYFGGAFEPPVELGDLASLTVSGNLVGEVNRSNFSAKDPHKWLKNFGANGNVSAGFSLGLFSIDYTIAKSTLRYDSAVPSLALSGVFDPAHDVIHGLPFGPKVVGSGATLKVAGYVANNASSSFLDIEGNLGFGPSFVAQTINGKMHVTGTGGSFAGSAHFAATTIDVSGAIYKSYVTFSGEIDHDYGFTYEGVGGSIKTTIKASFDSRNTKVTLSATGKACAFGSCDKVGSFEVTEQGGHIKICANVPGVGKKCDTLD